MKSASEGQHWGESGQETAAVLPVSSISCDATQARAGPQARAGQQDLKTIYELVSQKNPLP